MNTIAFTFEELTVGAVKVNQLNEIAALDSGSGSINRIESCYFSPHVTGSIVDNDSHQPTGQCRKFTLDIGGIEWSLTAEHAISGDVVTYEAYSLTPKTYIDAYGKLHLGDEVEDGDRLTVTLKLVNKNPSGSGYELVASNPFVLFFEAEANDPVGNFNAVDGLPYIAYQSFDTFTPASGVA